MVFIHYYAVSLICILALPAETCVSVQRQQQRQRTASQLCTRPDFMRFLNFLLYCARLDRPLPLLARLQSPFFFLLFFFILFSTENFLALLSLFTFECVYMLPNTHTYTLASAACLCHLLLIFTANLQTHWPIGCMSVRPFVSNEHCIHNYLLSEKFTIAFRCAGLTAYTHICARKTHL